MKKTYRLLSIPLVLALLMAGLGPSLALDRQSRLDVMSAAVQISLVEVDGDDVYYLSWGSGTIISADGFILTNCHVADPIRYGYSEDEIPEFDYLGVSLTVRSDRPPQLAYLAVVDQADPRLDLAVIRIVATIDGQPVDPEDLNLPYVELGDSDEIEVGDGLNIFGFPGIGDETITFTRGVVSGFTLDAAIDGRAWIKTDATIAGGNSGGTGVDEDGNLVGVPTRGGDVDCRVVTDTNGDGRLDDQDTCIPIGGFINALRPVNLAKPLIQRALDGLPDPNKQGQREGGAPKALGEPEFSNLFFADGVTEFNQPLSVVTSLPSGATSLYLFFDYENMDSGMTLEMKVALNGRDLPDWGLPPGPWGGGDQGIWWVGWSEADFVDGRYMLTLLVDGEEMGEAEIEIGGRVQQNPTFSDIVFSLESTADDEPVEPSVLFPAGIDQIMAFFEYENMSDGMDWTRTWLIDGEEALSKEERWDSGRSGSYVLELSSSRGLLAGAYRLELYIEDELVALSNFRVTGEEGQGAAFEPIVFAEGEDRRGDPVNAAQSFASGLEELHAFSDYNGMEDGLDFAIHWYVDGQKVIESPYEWDGGESGTWHDYLYNRDGQLPDAEYTLELVLDGQVIQSGTTVVGAGTQPDPGTPGKLEDGVLIQGTITDLDSGRAIEGALFLVVKPGITTDTFQWTEEELYTIGETDRQGFFRLPDLLARGECYTMIIGADGYWPYSEDGVCIEQDADDVIDLELQLEKK